MDFLSILLFYEDDDDDEQVDPNFIKHVLANQEKTVNNCARQNTTE